jgi:hypothetical protein
MVQIRLLTCGLIAALASPGCQEKVNPVTSNVSYGPDDRFATRVLDSSDRAEVLTIMRQSVHGPVDDPARPAQYGVRWSDVALAADKAGRALELAVLSTTVEEDGAVLRIRLVSVGEIPIELVVRKVPPPQVYEASASAGLFEDRTTLAANLVREFHAAMRAYGSKPGWPPQRKE